MALFHGEQAEEFGVDHVGDALEVGLRVAELGGVAVHDDEVALVGADPVLVAFVEALEVVEADGLLVFAAALLYLLDEVGYGGADVNHEVGQFDERHHQVEEVGIVLEVAVAHQSLSVQVGREDACVLEDGAVLDEGVFRLRYLDHLLEAAVEEVDLQVERPAGHIGVEVGQVGVVLYRLETGRPAVVVGEHLGERGLTATDVSGNSNVHGVGGLFGEQVEELMVNFVHHEGEVVGAVLVVEIIDVDGQHAAAVLVVDEVLVAVVEVAQVFDGHGLLVVAAALLDVLHEVAHRRAQVNHKVGVAHDVGHVVEQFHVGAEVAVAEVAHGVVVGREHVDALEDGAVLDDGVVGRGNLQQVAEALLEKIHLECERPACNVLVVVLEIGVVVHRLEACLPSIVVGEHAREGGLTAAYVSGDGYVHGVWVCKNGRTCDRICQTKLRHPCQSANIRQDVFIKNSSPSILFRSPRPIAGRKATRRPPR